MKRFVFSDGRRGGWSGRGCSRPGVCAPASGVLFAGCTALLLQACESNQSAEWLSESVPQPEVFASGVISTAMREQGITFSPGGHEAYFTRRGRRSPPQILATRFEGGVWTEPSPVSFAASYDESPSLSRDGQTLVFTSRRPLPRSGDQSDNLWLVRRGSAGWEDPTPLPGSVNRLEVEDAEGLVGDELGPVLLDDHSLLYWSRMDPDWGADILRSEVAADGSYGPPVPLRINSTGDEMNAALSPDGRFLVFQGYRDADGPGNQDLYVSTRNAFGWDRPMALPEPFNSTANDGYPSFSPDGRFLFFASDRNAQGGDYDIWWVEFSALGVGSSDDSAER